MDDFKFLAIFLVLPLAFWAWGSNFDYSGAQFHGNWNWEAPTVTYVPEGTPGAMTFEEFRDSGASRWTPGPAN